MQQYLDNKEKIIKAFIAKRDSTPRNFWCHTKEATEFYAYWDNKFAVIQAYLQKQWKVTSQNF